MIQIDLLGRKSHTKEFCDTMHLFFQCRKPENCDIWCPFQGAEKVQELCRRRGITIRKAVQMWIETPVTDKVRWQVIADVIGCPAKNVKAVLRTLQNDRN